MSGTADRRLVALLERSSLDGLLSADPGVVRLLTGHAVELETGPSPFGLPPVVLATGDGVAVAIAHEDDLPAAPGVRTYAVDGPSLDARAEAAAAAVAEALRAFAPGCVVGIDDATVPAAVAAVAPRSRPLATASLTAVKTAAEVDEIARAVALADAGQAAARGATRAGATELELWQAVGAAVERAAGGRVPLLADLVSGPRTAEIGGPPSARPLAAGDAVLCDLAPRGPGGLWADSCATWSAWPTAALEVRHAAAREALDAALAALRPGAVAGEVDAAARAVLAGHGLSCPHHVGHGVGFSYHEEPRIVPGGATILEEGMVVALEPGAYGEGIGARVEVVAVVEAAGARVLSGHALTAALEEPEPPSGLRVPGQRGGAPAE